MSQTESLSLEPQPSLDSSSVSRSENAGDKLAIAPLLVCSAILAILLLFVFPNTNKQPASPNLTDRVSGVSQSAASEVPKFDERRFKERLNQELEEARSQTQAFAESQYRALSQELGSKATSSFIPWATALSTKVQLKALRAADSWDRTMDQLFAYNFPRHSRDVRLVRDKYHELVISPRQLERKLRNIQKNVMAYHGRTVAARITALEDEFSIPSIQDLASTAESSTRRFSSSPNANAFDGGGVASVALGSPGPLTAMSERIAQMKDFSGRATDLANSGVNPWREAGMLVPSTYLLGRHFPKALAGIGNLVSKTAGVAKGASLSAVPGLIAADPAAASVLGLAVMTWFVVEHMNSKKESQHNLRNAFNEHFVTLRTSLGTATNNSLTAYNQNMVKLAVL